MIPFSPPKVDQKTIDEVVDALRSGWITTGPKTKSLEDKVAKYTDLSNGLCVNSCTSGLFLMLKWFGIKEGDEVIVPEYSFIIYRIYSRMFGAKVRYAKEENFTPSVQSILDCVSKKTKIVFLANPNLSLIHI